MSSFAFPCPPGMHNSGGTCVLDDPATHYPNTTPSPTGPSPTPQPGGGGGAEQPGDCAAKGKVWRGDTNKCEFEDERHNMGQDTCGGPLPNCPPGQDVWCDFTDAKFKCAQSSGWSDSELCRVANKKRVEMGKPEKSCAELGYGGGGGGGAARGGNSGPAPMGGGGQSAALSALLQGNIEGLLNAPSRFTPEAMQGLYGEITRQRSNANARGEAAVRADAARRGMSRAGLVGAGIRDVHNKSEIAQGQSIVGVQMQKIVADHQDKLDALDRAQRFLDSLRDNEYRYVLVGEQRRQYDANLALAYANMNQQRSMLNAQLQSQWDMLRAQQGFYLLTQGT